MRCSCSRGQRRWLRSVAADSAPAWQPSSRDRTFRCLMNSDNKDDDGQNCVSCEHTKLLLIVIQRTEHAFDCAFYSLELLLMPRRLQRQPRTPPASCSRQQPRTPAFWAWYTATSLVLDRCGNVRPPMAKAQSNWVVVQSRAAAPEAALGFVNRLAGVVVLRSERSVTTIAQLFVGASVDSMDQWQYGPVSLFSSLHRLRSSM